MTKTYGNFTDFIDFSRASSGTALRKVSYGPELVTNGTFDTDVSGWTGADCSIAAVSGELEATYTAATQWVYAPVNTTAGKVYKVIVQGRSDNAVNWRIQAEDSVFGGTLLEQGPESAFTASLSTKELTFVAVSDTTVIELFMRLTSGTAYFDNISVKEVTFDQADGTLELFNHPAGIPRVEYDSNGNGIGLLIEEQRTNLVTYSNDFTSAGSWSAVGVERISNQATALDGTKTADFVYATSTGTDRRIYKLVTLTDGLSYTSSVFAKYAGKKYIRLYNPTINQYAAFDLINGLVETYTTDDATIEDMGGGWYKCSVVDTAGPSSNYHYIQVADSVNSDNTTSGASYGVYLWGAQLEQGSFATSLIPTSGATATRSADIADIATANFGYNPKAGTLVVEFQASDWTNDQRYVVGSNTSSARWVYSNNGITSVTCYDGTSKLDGGTLTASQVMKVAVSTSKTEKVLSLNGGVQSNATDGSMASSTTDFFIGSLSGQPQNSINGHIKSIKYRPRRNSNTQLQEFTS